MSNQVASGWSPRTAVSPCIAISAVCAYSLYILSAPRRYRLENLALVFVLAAVFGKSFDDLYPDDRMNAVFAHGVLMWLVHMVHITLVRGNTNFITGNSTQSSGRELPEGGFPSVSSPRLGPYHRAYKMLYNFRGIGTSWQVVKTPQQGPGDEATNQQSRNRFLLHQLFTILCRYFALATFYELSESGVLGWPTGGRLTARETAGRTHVMIDFLLHSWLWLASWHECLSVVFVCLLRLDEPHEWPPLYGNLLEAYTIRRFWSKFWHRIVYAPFRAVADGISAHIFGRGNRGAARRLINVVLVFLLSGLLHLIRDSQDGLCNYWGSGIFYFIQPLGFVLEALAQSAWAPIRKRVPGPRVISILERTLGYMWVLAWFYLLLPQRFIAEASCRAKVRL